MNGFVDRQLQRLTRLAIPEVIVGLVLILIWVLPITLSNLVAGLALFALPLLGLYVVAIESGKSFPAVLVSVWFAVSTLASYAELGPTNLFLLFACGVSVLALHETIRLAHTHRRQAKVDPSIYTAAATGLGVSAGIGLIGSIIALSIISAGGGRTWLWMPAAVGAVLLIGLALTVVPGWRASDTSRNRWVPGERVPPQPVGLEDLSAARPPTMPPR